MVLPLSFLKKQLEDFLNLILSQPGMTHHTQKEQLAKVELYSTQSPDQHRQYAKTSFIITLHSEQDLGLWLAQQLGRRLGIVCSYWNKLNAFIIPLDVFTPTLINTIDTALNAKKEGDENLQIVTKSFCEKLLSIKAFAVSRNTERYCDERPSSASVSTLYAARPDQTNFAITSLIAALAWVEDFQGNFTDFLVKVDEAISLLAQLKLSSVDDREVIGWLEYANALLSCHEPIRYFKESPNAWMAPEPQDDEFVVVGSQRAAIACR